MNALLLLIGWSILFLLSWPVALLALVVWPFVWLLSIPLRLIGLGRESQKRMLPRTAIARTKMTARRPQGRDIRAGIMGKIMPLVQYLG